MGTIYRHLQGKDGAGSRTVSVLPAARRDVTIRTFILTNTCDTDVECELYISKTASYTTGVDSEGNRISAKTVTDNFYLFKGITIPVNTSMNVIEMTGGIEYGAGRSLQVTVLGDNTNTLDAIMSYE